MEIGESVGVNVDVDGAPPCGFCGEHHPARKAPEKLETIAGVKAGWKRKSLTPSDAREVAGLYPEGVRFEVHHCIALSAFCVGLGSKRTATDFIPRLNHWLDKGGYSPNRDKNLVNLPARAQRGTTKYRHFGDTVRQGRPLQPHLGQHDRGFFAASTGLLTVIARYFSNETGVCEALAEENLSDLLKRLIAQAENYALRCTAGYVSPFRLHRRHLVAACTEAVREADRAPILGRTYGSDQGAALARDVVDALAARLDLPGLNLPTGDFERRLASYDARPRR